VHKPHHHDKVADLGGVDDSHLLTIFMDRVPGRLAWSSQRTRETMEIRLDASSHLYCDPLATTANMTAERCAWWGLL